MKSWKGNSDSMLNFVSSMIPLPSPPNYIILDWSVLLDSRLVPH